MIRKSDIVEAINDLSHDLLTLSIKVQDLETELRKLKGKTCKCKEDKLEKAIKAVTEPKRRGRPLGSKNNNQPRDKSGKFAKK
jgi:hypothetical protein